MRVYSLFMSPENGGYFSIVCATSPDEARQIASDHDDQPEWLKPLWLDESKVDCFALKDVQKPAVVMRCWPAKETPL